MSRTEHAEEQMTQVQVVQRIQQSHSLECVEDIARRNGVLPRLVRTWIEWADALPTTRYRGVEHYDLAAVRAIENQEGPVAEAAKQCGNPYPPNPRNWPLTSRTVALSVRGKAIE